MIESCPVNKVCQAIRILLVYLSTNVDTEMGLIWAHYLMSRQFSLQIER